MSYSFWIKCSKTNIRIQKICQEHQNAESCNYLQTKHFEYRLCCSHFEKKDPFIKLDKQKTTTGDKDYSTEGILNKSISTKVTLNIKYSLDNEESIYDYLHLKKLSKPKQIAHKETKSKVKDSSFHIKSTDPKTINGYKMSFPIKLQTEVIAKNIISESCRDYEHELKKVLIFNNGCLPENLQTYLENKYGVTGFKFSCEICKLSFPEEYLLKTHIEISHILPDNMSSGKTKYKCVECKKKFKSFIALKEHLKWQHVWYKCKVCQKQYIGITTFEEHVKKNHSGYRPFQCPICGKLFKTKLLFSEHEKYTHESEKPYTCKICNKKWISLINLDMHIRTHNGSKLLKCQDCDESFDDEDSLEQHRKVHHIIKKVLHECDLCLAEFTNLGNLTKHMKNHKDYKPHCCVMCDRRFPTLRHLKEHIAVKHEEQKVIMCELCDRTCLNENDLMVHIEEHAGEM